MGRGRGEVTKKKFVPALFSIKNLDSNRSFYGELGIIEYGVKNHARYLKFRKKMF